MNPDNQVQPRVQSEPEPTFLTAAEAAAWLRLSPVTIARWRLEGRGPVYRLFGRRIVYARSDLLSWADAQRRQSTSQQD